MFFIPRSFLCISVGLEKIGLTAIMVFKNTVSTAVVGLFGNDTSLAIIRCLLSSVIVAVMLTAISECQASPAFLPVRRLVLQGSSEVRLSGPIEKPGVRI